MGMDCEIYINDEDFDTWKGRYVYYYLHSVDSPMDIMKISYRATGGYGRAKCVIKIGYKNKKKREYEIYCYDHNTDTYGVDSEFVIHDMSDVLIVRVAVFSPAYGYKEKFNKKFQKEISLYNSNSIDSYDEIAILNAAQHDISANEIIKKITEKYWEKLRLEMFKSMCKTKI